MVDKQHQTFNPDSFFKCKFSGQEDMSHVYSFTVLNGNQIMGRVGASYALDFALHCIPNEREGPSICRRLYVWHLEGNIHDS